MKIISWNVNGIRAVAKKGFFEKLEAFGTDILCLQETKAQDSQVQEVLAETGGWHVAINSAVRKGYSGTAVLSKEKPISVNRGIGVEDHDQEGRVVAVEFEKFYLVNVYVPNSGQELVRLDYREQWDHAFLNYCLSLEAKKPVIICGDLNVAHEAIDIARPKANYNKTSGYTQREIDGLDRFLAAGYTDAFRYLYPDTVAYSWWSYRFQAKQKNIGWRIDYFLTSNKILDKVQDSFILPEVDGSDHCPVGLVLSL